MKKPGRGQGGAFIRTAATKNQTSSMKRLMRDYEEMEKNSIPTVGVTARPLDHDMFLWHANIRGPEGTPYEGGVFHLEMRIPTSYPHHPPQIQIFTKVPHPNIFNDYICLDMLRINQREEGVGWSSVYTIQSVLMQLQSFLFQEDLSVDKNTQIQNIKMAVKVANDFKCTTRNCKHGGKLSCWPPFNLRETQVKQFITLDSENELIEKELICYHTKLSYQDNQLGLGLKVSKVPRTGGIREAEAMFDYISIKAFLKDSVNWSSHNQRFSHWLPLYFGKKDNPDRFYKFVTHALSMIITNSTDNFKPEYILEVLPKIMVTLIYYIMDEKKHPSIRIIRILTHIHAMFLFLVQKHPQVETQIIKTLESFIKDDANRIKDVVPNLAVIMMIASATDKFKFSELVQSYFSELMDRQILWILLAIPQLIEQSNNLSADSQSAKLAFKAKITSFQMLCFNKLFLTEICQKYNPRKKLLEHYEDNLCKLRNNEQTEFQQKVMDIFKNIVDFDSFLKYVGLPEKTNQQLNELLSASIKNSERKKYHGAFDKINKMPETELQLQTYNERFETYTKFFQVNSVKQEDGDKSESVQYKVEIKQKDSTEDDWKNLCRNRWSYIKENLLSNTALTASDVSKLASTELKQKDLKSQDKIVTIIKNKYRQAYINYNIPDLQLPQLTWKMLYMRLDLQEFLSLIDMNPNFPELYKKLEVCNYIKLNTLIIPLVKVNNVKSGYYYLTAVLSKLSSLEYIELCGNQGVFVQPKAARSLKKGFSNFKENKGSCKFFSCSNFNVSNNLADAFYSHLSDMKDIESIRIEGCNLLQDKLSCKVFCHYLTDLTKIKELRLNNCVNLREGKLLADALMRMKSLEIVEYKNNPQSNLSAIIYNLSFSPNLKYLNFSGNYLDQAQVKQVAISIEKLLKISVSIEVIDASMIVLLNPNLTKEVWTTLGECRSIRVLNIGNCGLFDQNNIRNMGSAIAFNAKKNGKLEYLNLTGCIYTETHLTALYDSMCISEYDEQTWYGDPLKASKMIAINYPKVFHNNLKALQLSVNINLSPNFSLVEYNKHTNKKVPELVKLLRQSPQLETVDLSSTQQNKNIAQILSLALDGRQPNLNSKIKVLNLSKNYLGKEGAKLLSEVIIHNHFLEVLDVSKNFIGVSGAQMLSLSLKTNKSIKFINLFNNRISFDGAKAFADNVLPFNTVLEFLEIGHNRIRDKGLKAISDGIAKNPQSNIRGLGLRFNFLTKTGVEYLFRKLSQNANKVENIFVKNNLIDQFGNFFLNKVYNDNNLKMYVDSFNKLKYLDTERMERSIWVFPAMSNTPQQFKQFFQVTHPCGIVLDVRVRSGKTYANKTGPNIFAIIEFADPSSVKHALHIASQRWAKINGVAFRVFKAGTGTFFYMNKTSKQRSLQNAKMMLPVLPFDLPDHGAQMAIAKRQQSQIRGRGSGRGRGRGRGRGKAMSR